MMVLVLGRNGSGKSVYAEKLAARLSSGALYYIATMIPYGNEGKTRVEKHRKQRETMGFITMEKPISVSEILLPPNADILLEDVSNLLGNALFGGEKNGSAESVLTDIMSLCAKCRTAILVSIDGLNAAREYDDQTRAYIEEMDRLNGQLADLADTVITMCDGKPTFVKGDVYALD